MDDLRLAARRLIGSPAFTLFSIVTLLGIGATTAIFSVVDSAVLRPPAFRDVEEVVNLYHANAIAHGGLSARLSQFSTADYDDLRAAQTSFSGMAAWTRFRQTLIGGGGAEVILGEMVGGEYFDLLGIQAALGRTIQPHDDRRNAPAVIVLSDALWRRRFGAAANVIGQTVRLNGRPFEIVGVAPATFRGVDMPSVRPTPAWVPLAAAPILSPSSSGKPDDREDRWLFAKARLKKNWSLAASRAEVAAIGRQLDAAHPIGRDMPARIRIPPYVRRDWHVVPAAAIYAHESVHRVAVPMVWTVLTVVGLVLLIASTNLANLLLARGASRRQEFAVRIALGASRGRLVRELMVESAVMAVLGAAGAYVIAEVLIATVLSQPVALSGADGMTLQLAPAMNSSVLAAAAISTLLSLAVFGLLPALHVTRGALRDALAIDAASAAVPRWRGRRNLIACQVGVSVGLGAVAALCVQQIVASARHDAGLALDRIAAVGLNFEMQGEPEPRARQILEHLRELGRAEGSVQSTGLASSLPVGLGGRSAGVGAAGTPVVNGRLSSNVYARLITATPEVFPTLGVQLLRGRLLDARDTNASTPVAVVSELLARQVFGTTDAVGRDIAMLRQRFAGESQTPVVVTRTIIGVTADSDSGSIGRRESGVLYLPFAQHYEPAMMLIARTAADPDDLAALLKSVVARAYPELAVVVAGSGTAVAGGSNLSLKIMATMAGFLGVLALVLSMAGLYGVLSHLVARRTREMGLRLALGAERGDILRLVIGDGIRPVLEGLVLGAPFGIVLRMAMRPMFVRLLPTVQLEVLALVPIPFLLAAFLAAYLPAARAARVDPNTALRHL